VVDKSLAPHLNNVVFVEGGVRVIKRYKRLMLRRIRWTNVDVPSDDTPMTANNGDESDGEDSQKESHDFKCHLVWEGITSKPVFGKF